jgi:peroxiredoxin
MAGVNQALHTRNMIRIRSLGALAVLCLVLSGILPAAETPAVPVVERAGKSYVGAKALATGLQIGLKPLPGRAEFVLCHEDRCALISSVVPDANGEQLVEVHTLAKALHAEVEFSSGGKSVHFKFSAVTPAASPGQPQTGGFAPNFTLTTLTGKTVSLADYRGRRVLINSWASWCGCRNDLPKWQKFYEQHRTRNFEILSVAVDVQGPKVVRPYVEKAGVTFTVAVDQTDVLGRAFGLKLTPVSILVDELGIIRVQGGGPRQDFLVQVEAVLSEPLSEVRAEVPTTRPASIKVGLEKQIEAAPKDWRARTELAALLLAEQDFAAATKQLERATQLAPQQADVHFLSGQVLLQQEKREAALACFRQASQLDPENWRIRKQIWAIENPDKFYTKQNPDYRWQKEALEKERSPGTPASP